MLLGLACIVSPLGPLGKYFLCETYFRTSTLWHISMVKLSSCCGCLSSGTYSLWIWSVLVLQLLWRWLLNTLFTFGITFWRWLICLGAMNIPKHLLLLHSCSSRTPSFFLWPPANCWAMTWTSHLKELQLFWRLSFNVNYLSIHFVVFIFQQGLELLLEFVIMDEMYSSDYLRTTGLMRDLSTSIGIVLILKM